MSATPDADEFDRPEPAKSDLWEPPMVALDWDVDDPVDPGTVTLFADRSDTTTWVSADFEATVSLADAR